MPVDFHEAVRQFFNGALATVEARGVEAVKIDRSDHASTATLTSLIACRELVRECVAPFTKVDDPGG